ncbi:MAG TPA: hypothetical protein VM452_12615 [Caulifigura sp.]|nr:hypothetical protein [Caulifigura sp.]
MSIDDDFPSERPARRVKRKKPSGFARHLPSGLSLIPTVLCGAFGVLCVGLGLLAAGTIAYYNVEHGPIYHSGGVTPTLDQISLTVPNIGSYVAMFAAGVMFLFAAMRWKRRETPGAIGCTAGAAVLIIVNVLLATAHRNYEPAETAVAIASPFDDAGNGEAPAVSVPDPVALAAPQTGPQGLMLTIFLDKMTAAERARTLAVLTNEFRSLDNFVPGSLTISGNTLIWRATIPWLSQERHKDEAIAILRKNNVRLSQFSEQWLKGRDAARNMPSGQRPSG